MNTCYFCNNKDFSPADKDGMVICDKLPPGTYTIKFPPFGSPYFHQIDSIGVDQKLYGETEQQADRILNTYKQRTSSTGVLAVGEKGSGKTLLAKVLSTKGAEIGMPTILITEPLCGSEFFDIIQNLNQDAIIIFDEFDKVYGEKKEENKKDAQQNILTLLDGVFQTKKLFVFTANDAYKINEFMKNRPGRIFYRLDYHGLSNDFITEYCQDRLNNKVHIKAVCAAASLFEKFNFDILSALVEEMNRYNESPQDALKMLNAKPFEQSRTTYNIELFIDGKRINLDWTEDSIIKISPLERSENTIQYCTSQESANLSDYDASSTFTVDDLVSIDGKTGTITYKNKDGDVAKYKKEVPVKFNMTTTGALAYTET